MKPSELEAIKRVFKKYKAKYKKYVEITNHEKAYSHNPTCDYISVKNITKKAIETGYPAKDIINMITMYENGLQKTLDKYSENLKLLHQYDANFSKSKSRTKSILVVCANADKVQNLINIMTILNDIDYNPYSYNIFICNNNSYVKSKLFKHIAPESNIIKGRFGIDDLKLKGAPYDIILYQHCPPHNCTTMCSAFNINSAKLALRNLKHDGKLIVHSVAGNPPSTQWCGNEFINIINAKLTKLDFSHCYDGKIAHIWSTETNV